MGLSEEAKSKRDELVEKYVSASYPAMTRLKMEWDFKNGFDAGYEFSQQEFSDLTEQSKKMKELLQEIYEDKSIDLSGVEENYSLAIERLLGWGKKK